MQLEDFIEMIIAEPDVDEHRLVLADYLEENGDPRAEMIRLQFELKAMSKFDPKRAKLRTRELKLLRELGGLGSVPEGAKIREWHGGFVDEVEMTVARFMSKGEKMFEASPVRSVVLTATSKRFKKMAGLSFLDRPRKLTMKNNHQSDNELIQFLESPGLSNLRELNIHNADTTDVVAETIAAMPHLASLKSLSLSGNIGEAAAIAIAESSTLTGLESLSLRRNVGDDGAQAIAQSVSLRNLTELRLLGGFGEESVAMIHRATFRESLETLDLAYSGRGGFTYGTEVEPANYDGVFAKVRPFPNLKSLSLGYQLPPQFLVDIVNSYAEQRTIEILEVDSNQVDDLAIEVLAGSPMLSDLKRLVLSDNNITVRGVDTIVESEYWKKKTKINLNNNAFRAEDVTAIKKKHGKSFGGITMPTWHWFEYDS